MVQLPEPCDEKSEAYKAGYKTICDIGKERIRRAGDKLYETLKTSGKDFRTLRKTSILHLEKHSYQMMDSLLLKFR